MITVSLKSLTTYLQRTHLQSATWVMGKYNVYICSLENVNVGCRIRSTINNLGLLTRPVCEWDHGGVCI